jgi:hypothetical protein
VAVAIERLRRDRNALPAQLADLVPQYLREIPVDPYSGQPLLFRPGKDDTRCTALARTNRMTREICRRNSSECNSRDGQAFDSRH